MIRPIGLRIAEGDLGLLEVATLYSMLHKSGRKEICLLNKGELHLAHTGHEREE